MVTTKTKNLIGAFITFVGGCGGVYLVLQLNNFISKILFGILTIFCFISFAFNLKDIIFGEKIK